ncbi:DUF1214 domain-containing protein, partial [Mesorhizobium sp. M00.F.Ca.ET.149.01.1.1]
SIDILIQNESPGADKEANWLPAPKGKFVLMMRTYWPNESDPSTLGKVAIAGMPSLAARSASLTARSMVRR